MIKNALEAIDATAKESIDNSQAIQVPEAISPGDGIWQGDVILHMQDRLPHGASLINVSDGDFQLAPGVTKGSRHIIPGRFMAYVSVYQIDDGDALSDLCIEASASFDLTHPEHANHVGYPPGVYRIRHQQNAQRERVLD